MALFLVIAVPGLGKSTILQALKKEIEEIEIVNFGDFMFEVAKEKYGIKDRDEMRKKIVGKDYEELQKTAAEKIAKLKESGKIIFVDTHMSIKKPEGYYPGTPLDIAEILKPDCIIIFETLPKIVIERRKKDEKRKKPEITKIGTIATPRKREIESEEEIELQQQINRMFAITVSSKVKCTVKIINLRFEEKYDFEHVDVAIKELKELIKKFSGIS